MKHILLFSGIAAILLCSNCEKTTDDCTDFPVVSAGKDTSVYNSTSLELLGITSEESGTWAIIEGLGGAINSNADKYYFTGTDNSTYKLKWESINECGTSSDTLEVRFIEEICTDIAVADAGNDITLNNETSVILNATLDNGSGEWSIITGSDGSLSDPADAKSEFTGKSNEKYTLIWTVTTSCSIAKDTITVTFEAYDCGNEMTVDQMVENIHWIDNAGFRIDGSQLKIYIDPQSITKNDEADFILITHSHSDHFSSAEIDKLAGPKTIIIAPEDCKYSGTFAKRVTLLPGDEYQENECINIKAVPAYNIVKTTWHPKSKNYVGYVITINGVSIYHAGDTERIPEMKDITCDIAMLPLGQTYTMDSVSDAAESAKDVHAKVAIPMHYGGPEGTAADATAFKDLLNGIIKVVIKTKGQ